MKAALAIEKQEKKGKEKSALYRPLGFAMVRTPALPVQAYTSVVESGSDESLLLAHIEDEKVRLAIASASPSLMEALLSPAKSKRDRLRALRKLRRYLVRMATRPTPFGAFAGVAIAPLGERTTLRIDETRTTYFRHLDMPWLLEFVHRAESDPEIFRQLALQVNPCVLTRGGRVYLRESNPLLETDAVASASLRASHLVKRVLAEARVPISHENLAAMLATSPRATEEKVRRFLAELWRQGFLLTELRPPLTSPDPARHVLERLQSLDGADQYRLELERAIITTGIDSSPGAQPAAGLDESELPLRTGAKPVTCIESVLCAEGELNAAVAREAARAAEMLLSMTSSPSGLSPLRAYRQSFENRYGTDREVPLLELIDPEYGIGLPAGYDGKDSTTAAVPIPEGRLRSQALFDIALNANHERRLVVELDDEMQRRLRTWTPNLESAPSSLDLHIFVSAASSRDIDEGRFTVVVGPNVGAMEAGRNLGRFAGSLGTIGIAAYRETAEVSARLEPDKHCVELSYLPKKIRLANVVVRPSTRQYEIDVGVHPGVPLDHSIHVDELVVGLRAGRFYVRWPGLPGELHICSGHMANPRYAPAICRLLVNMQSEGMPQLGHFDWGMAGALPFLPRICVGRAVLAPAQWRISADIVRQRFSTGSFEEFRRSLAVWRTAFDVPEHVYLAEADNRLLLDLENDQDIEDLRMELARLVSNRPVVLEEVYPDLRSTWLPGRNGMFVSEYVVPLVLNSNDQMMSVKDQPPPWAYASASSHVSAAAASVPRMKTPGTDWLYIKLYGPPSLQDDLLCGPISEFTRSAVESRIADRWFFLRYSDPDPHIRLRFHGFPSAIFESLLPKLLGWAQALVDQDLCLRFTIDTYEREIERYGGPHAIENVETLFSLDSELSLAILQGLGPPCPLNRVELGVFGLDFLFRRLGSCLSERLALFQGMVSHRHESGAAYRERKKLLLAALTSRGNAEIVQPINRVTALVERNASAITEIGASLRGLEAEGRLTRPLDGVSRSLAHMHCNRLGLDVSAERLAYGLLLRAYDALDASGRQQSAREAPEENMAVRQLVD